LGYLVRQKFKAIHLIQKNIRDALACKKAKIQVLKKLWIKVFAQLQLKATKLKDGKTNLILKAIIGIKQSV
jgi:hypothetical protein